MPLVTFTAASSSGSQGSTGTGNISATFPATIAANDILLLHFAHGNNTVQAAATYAATTSWTLIQASSVSLTRSWVYGRRAVGTETGTTTVVVTNGSTINVQSMRIYGFRNVTTAATFWEGATQIAAASTSSTLKAADLTTTGRNRLAVQCSLNWANSSHVDFTGEVGTDYTIAWNQSSGPAQMCLQTGNVSSAMTVTGGVESISTISWTTIGFALIPKFTGSTWISAHEHSITLSSPRFLPISF